MYGNDPPVTDASKANKQYTKNVLVHVYPLYEVRSHSL
jgi:hypothetical protein